MVCILYTRVWRAYNTPFLRARFMHFVGVHKHFGVHILHTKKHGNPYSEFVLCIYPSKVHTHTAVNTHTPWTHTHTVNTHPEQWAAIYAAEAGDQLGVRCLAQGHFSRVWPAGPKLARNLWITSLTLLTIRPRLPLVKHLPKYKKRPPKYKAPTPHPWILTYQLHIHTKVHFCVQIVCQIETENRAIETQIHEIGLE